MKSGILFGICSAMASIFSTGCNQTDPSSERTFEPTKKIDPGKDPAYLRMTVSEQDTMAAVQDSSSPALNPPAGSRDISAMLAKAADYGPGFLLCSNLSYGGTCKWIGKNLDYNDLRYLAGSPSSMNDVATSLKFTGGATYAYVCMDANWTGTCYTIEQDQPDLRQVLNKGTLINMNDRITSIKWTDWGPGGFVRIWKDPNYTGSTMDLYMPYDYNFIPGGFNDQISSFMVVGPQGLEWEEAYFYQHPEWQSTFTPWAYPGSKNCGGLSCQPVIHSYADDQFSSMAWKQLP